MALINSLAQVFTISESTAIAAASLAPYSDDDPGKPNLSRERAFQYFPETISDSKGSDWAAKKIPGGSHPLYQWISGTERIISFTAVFSDEKNPENDGGFSIGGTISDLLNLGGDKADLYTATGGIASALSWLRGFTYPSYVGDRSKPPPTGLLILPGSGISSGTVSGLNTTDTVPVIMTQCDITYEGFFRNGTARFATVALSFAETVQIGDSWGFVGRESIWDNGSVFDRYTKRGSDARQPVNRKPAQSSAGNIAANLPAGVGNVFA